MRWLLAIFLGLALASASPPLAAQQAIAPDVREARQVPPPLKVYQGRRIAQTMHYLGAEWLVRDNREQEERCSLLLAQLNLKRGMTVCDMGCGNGFYTLPLAQALRDGGHVYAVDIQPEMLKLLENRAEQQRLRNITPILSTATDSRLPKEKIDLLLLVDVYHEFSNPEEMLSAMRESLAPGGMCVLVEFRGEDRGVPIKPEHKMTKTQILKEWHSNRFKLVKEFDGLPWQHLMFFARDDDKGVSRPILNSAESIPSTFFSDSPELRTLPGERWSISSKSWESDEKTVVEQSLRRAQKIAPYLFERVVLYRELRLCRVVNLNGSVLASARYQFNDILLPDRFFAESPDLQTHVILHELAHLVDIGGSLSMSREWSALVRHQIDWLRNTCHDKDIVMGINGIDPQGVADPLVIKSIVTEAKRLGIVTIYSCTTLRESFADHVAVSLSPQLVSALNSDISPEVARFLDLHAVGKGHEANAGTEKLHQIFSAFSDHRNAKCIELAAEVPASLDVRHVKALALLRSGDVDAALEIWTKCIEHCKEYPEEQARFYVWRSRGHEIRGNDEIAVADMTRALALIPGEASWWFERGELRRRLSGVSNEVLADLAKSMDLDGGSSVARLPPELQEKVKQYRTQKSFP